ncbi:ribonuclease HII [Endobacter medicaginis]|uniref:Ribonuclease HII n=2 Tax=Endobacter medicaginis TaxID=1181271 RepID=A0A839V143_9PROT|nr:ribonuclease HII [Endobacter medicaginis]MBB3173332.1 ribonuclease HII [Endobacter medicaginis]MCX5475707.1 ribonuclease HII [Endobacter medicaginis]
MAGRVVPRAKAPDFRRERALGGRVAGVDEAGRGPLAGPVVAAAVVFDPAVLRRGVPRALAAVVDDSKKLSAEARALAFEALRSTAGVEIGIGAASVTEIGRINILQASLLAMRRAVARLPAPPGFVLVDGDRVPPSLPCAGQAVIGGDGLCLSIAAASIVAKVVRDRAMWRLSQRHGGYGWERNAGYATADHRLALHALGPTRHHRTGFGTVRQLCLFAPAGECVDVAG